MRDPGAPEGHVAQIADFVDAIETGRQPRPSAHDGRAALELVLAVYQSADERRPVTLPLDPEAAR